MKRVIFLGVLWAGLIACTDVSPGTVGNPGGYETGDPALHAVRNNQLHELMDRMSALMQERFMTEPELDAERRRYAQRISTAAQNLSQTLDAVLAATNTLKLTQSEETTFKALTQKLRQQAQELQTQAEQNRVEAIPQTLQQMNSTCTSCHALFRKL